MDAIPRPGRTGAAALRVIIACTVLSTSIHYTHNYVDAEHYPPVFPFLNPTAYRVGIVVLWPLLTAAGLAGYRLYVAGRTREAQRMLAAYSVAGLTSVGHFLGGNPHVPPFFYATMFTDFLAGSAVVGFVLWTRTQANRAALAA